MGYQEGLVCRYNFVCRTYAGNHEGIVPKSAAGDFKQTFSNAGEISKPTSNISPIVADQGEGGPVIGVAFAFLYHLPADRVQGVRFV